METRISHSIPRLLHFTDVCLLLAFLVTIGGGEGKAQAVSKGGVQPSLSDGRITEWEDSVTGALHFLHRLFPDIDPKSKTIILDNNRWGHGPAESDDIKLGHSSTRLFSFAVFVCEPNETLSGEQSRDTLNNRTLHCSELMIFADILLSSSQLGLVPSHINIGRPAADKRWDELSATLLAHPQWSKAQKEEAMRLAGVKYGENSHDEVIGPINDSVRKLKPFLGNLVIDSVDYLPPSQPLSSSKLLPPVWNVEAHPLGQDQKKRSIKYVLVFNAFDGSLASVHHF